MKFILIAGLPCSGKTTYAKSLKGLLIDDPFHFQNDIIKPIEESKSDVVIIADPCFIFQSVRQTCERSLRLYFPNCELEWIFFENDPEKCLLNYERRVKNGDTRDVKDMIKNWNGVYHIPENAKVLPVWKD